MLHSLMLVYVVVNHCSSRIFFNIILKRDGNLDLVSETHTLYELKAIITLYEPVCIYCDPFTVFDIF